MPLAQASATKANVRNELAGADREFATTTSAGAADGTTVVSSDLSGNRQVDEYRDKWLLLTSGGSSGQFRRISNFAAGTGTFTVDRAFSAQVTTSVTFEIFTISPHLFTLATNKAIPKAHPAIYRPEIDFLVTDQRLRDSWGLPRGMVRVYRVQAATSGYALLDRFDRADSTTSIGGSWVATTGVWGISSERGYSVDDADGDLITYDADAPDPFIRCTVRGTLNSGTIYRSPALVFRLAEDRTGAIPAAASRDYLLVRLLNGVVDLRKVDAGTESSLTTATLTTSDGTDYEPQVHAEGNRVRVWVDGREYITYELQGLNLKFDGVRVGVRWDKGGSPATAARIDNFRCYKADSWAEHHDWRVSHDRQVIQFGPLGKRLGLRADGLVLLEGSQPLSLLASDTTWGTLASDTTAALEIATTDDAWPLFIAYCRAELYELMADPAWNGNRETIPMYQARAKAAQAEALRGDHAMPLPSQGIMYPY